MNEIDPDSIYIQIESGSISFTRNPVATESGLNLDSECEQLLAMSLSVYLFVY